MRILSCALKTSFLLMRMSSSCQTWLVPLLFFPPHINFCAKIIRHKYSSSAPWKEPCHWLDACYNVKNPTWDCFFFFFLGLIWFPLFQEENFDVFPFLERYIHWLFMVHISYVLYKLPHWLTADLTTLTLYDSSANTSLHGWSSSRCTLANGGS